MAVLAGDRPHVTVRWRSRGVGAPYGHGCGDVLGELLASRPGSPRLRGFVETGLDLIRLLAAGLSVILTNEPARRRAAGPRVAEWWAPGSKAELVDRL